MSAWQPVLLGALSFWALSRVVRGVRGIAQDLRDLQALDVEDQSGAWEDWPWEDHTEDLAAWAALPQEDREMSGALVQAADFDAYTRGSLRANGLDEYLGENPDAAFIAYAIAEMVVMGMVGDGFKSVAPVLLRQGIAADDLGAIRRTMAHAGWALTIRLAWRASQTVGIDTPEPFGESFSMADMSDFLDSLAPESPWDE